MCVWQRLTSPSQNCVPQGRRRLDAAVQTQHSRWKAQGKHFASRSSDREGRLARSGQAWIAKPSRVDGIWLGSLQAGGASLRIQVHIKNDQGGKEYCLVDSLDQHAMGLDCAAVTFSGDELGFEVPVVKGPYASMLSTDGNSVTGSS